MFRSLVGHFFKPSQPTLDNLVFRLHYRVTVGLLLVCAVALLWKINYGVPIRCAALDHFDSSFLNDHCWYNGKFTLPSSEPIPRIAVEKRYDSLHRWVVIAVLAQAAFFYLPRVIWKSLEGRLVYQWTWNIGQTKKAAKVDKVRKKLITNYLRTPSYKNLMYTAGHVFCELLNLVNVGFQLVLVSHLLQITIPSLDLLIRSRSERVDASALTSFPLTSTCELQRYGPSGDVQKHETTCFMSINGLMESFFIYQWIWFAVLAILSGLALLYRVASLVVPQLRVLRLSAKVNLINRTVLKRAISRLGIGEWFVLYMLSRNLDIVHMRDILEQLDDKNQSYQLHEIPEPSESKL